MNKQTFVEFGKQGAKKRWEVRYWVIGELSKHYSKDHQNEFIKWPTKYLIKLLTYTEYGRRK